MKYLGVFLILLLCNLHAVSLEEISDKPASREKNFLIWQYLHQDINASGASEAFYQVDTVNQRFLSDYAQKTDEAEIKYTVACMDINASSLTTIKNDDCLFLALTPSKAQNLSKSERETIASRLENKFGNTQWLRTMNRENHFQPNTDISASLNLFLLSSPAYRHTYFNHTLDAHTLSVLSSLSGFGTLVYATVTDPLMDQLQRSLAQVGEGKYDAQTHFYLAINALKFDNKPNTLSHLKQAQTKKLSIMDRDKIDFWLYQITKDPEILSTLARSLDINMYTLWAKEKLGIETQNYFTALPTTHIGGFSGDNPFEWNALYQEIMTTDDKNLSQLIERYEGEGSLAVQAYMLERPYRPYIHNFTTPYDRYMIALTCDQKAMLYALMRQETQLIPGLISRSFALGLMQIMPFNVDTISKVSPLKITSYDDMFNPAYNIPYAIEHMKHIDNTLINPVFKAYAYNGGLGFTKRLIVGTGQFLPGEYEPFMSMELVGNAESREYGKKVLANYVIYKKIFGEEVSITSLFDTLVQPALSDYCRVTAPMPPRFVSQSE
jgi:soluble lytic murein transglycosylase